MKVDGFDRLVEISVKNVQKRCQKSVRNSMRVVMVHTVHSTKWYKYMYMAFFFLNEDGFYIPFL